MSYHCLSVLTRIAFSQNDEKTHREASYIAGQSQLKDCKGAVRMLCKDTDENGACRVDTRFLVWIGHTNFKTWKSTLVFGQIVEGMNRVVKKVAEQPKVWHSADNGRIKVDIRVVKCGTLI